jgi:hypothetical protein
MYITIDELYEMKNKYSKEILELEMKKAVIDDLIAFAEAKEVATEEDKEESVEDVEPEAESETEY